MKKKFFIFIQNYSNYAVVKGGLAIKLCIFCCSCKDYVIYCCHGQNIVWQCLLASFFNV